MVDAAQEFDVAIGQIAHPIARPVQPRPRLRADGSGMNFCAVSFRLVQILPRQSIAADVQLTGARPPEPAACGDPGRTHRVF